MTNQHIEDITRLLKPVELNPLPANPLVSILTANYNYAHYLCEALDSALAQTYANFEVIVCDDGSKDNSCEIVERYARRDPRVRLIRKENGGVSSALNAAYRVSKGDIICLLDADDRFLPKKLEMLVEAFQSHPDCGFLGHRMFHIDAEGHRRGVTPLLADVPSGWYGPNVALYGDIPYGLGFGSGICLRREIGALIFPLPERFRVGADGVIMSLAPLMTPLVGIPVALTEYRYHGRNVSNTAQVTVQSLDSDTKLNKIYWELRRQYLCRIHPRLGEFVPEFDRRLGAMVSTYVYARLVARGGTLRAYEDMTRADGFFTLPPATRWFWRLSVLLPRPFFRYVLRPGPLKQFVGWMMKRVPSGSLA